MFTSCVKLLVPGAAADTHITLALTPYPSPGQLEKVRELMDSMADDTFYFFDGSGAAAARDLEIDPRGKTSVMRSELHDIFEGNIRIFDKPGWAHCEKRVPKTLRMASPAVPSYEAVALRAVQLGASLWAFSGRSVVYSVR
jgi:hypothetical protein